MNDFIEQLLSYNYISFDVFDTLIYRTVPKTNDQLKLIPYIASKVYGINLRSSFVNERIQIERIVRNSNNGREITIDQIYSKIPDIDSIKDLLIKIECDIEVENCVGNKIMIDILTKCRELGKKIVITTDMYLPRIVFERILQKIDVNYDYLFISSEEGVTKRTGELFNVLLKKMNIESNEIIHIGDDLNNDIIQAQKKGITSLMRLMGDKHNDIYFPFDRKNIIEQHFYEFLSKGLQNGNNTSAYQIGYNVIAPILYEYCCWINHIKEEKKIEKIFFVAREGYLIMKCYLQIFPNQAKDVEYVRINKNLLRLPSLSHADAITTLT